MNTMGRTTRVSGGVLGKALIEKRLAKQPEDVEGLVITPLRRDPKTQRLCDIDRDSIDLRLGSRFLLPRAHHLESLTHHDQRAPNAVCKRSDRPSDVYHRAVQEVHIPRGEKIVIPAHGTVLGSTLEYLKLPYDVSGQVLTRSSLARKFITIETAPWIHPLYRGCLTLEIANASSTPVQLSPGDSIGQLVLFLVAGSRRPSRDEIGGSYFGPVYAELPM